MSAEVVAAVRRSAEQLAVPDGIAMLAAVGITLSWFTTTKDTLVISMIVPQRDGPSENDMVGLFADVRNISVKTGGLSFAGVAVRLHHITKERLWGTPGMATQYDGPFVNFEWTDFAQRRGFSQVVHIAEWAETSMQSLKIAVDQPDQQSWRMRVAFDKRQYTYRLRERFFVYFEQALYSLLERPLDLVWPVLPGNCPQPAE